MKKCRQCGTLLDEHVDTCTTCGINKPFEKEKMKTEYDLTVMFDAIGSDVSLYRVKKRKTLLILSWTLGFVGAPLFYLGFKKRGFISLLSYLVVFLIPALILYFTNIVSPLLAFLLPALILILLFNTISGIIFLLNPSYKDNNGEYLR